MNSFDDSPHLNDFFVSTDKTLLDVPFITDELTRTYWGGWLTLNVVMRSIDNSLCFGLYYRPGWAGNPHPLPHTKQVGFARVVTDYATFAWICDVIIAKPYQKRGLATFLMNIVMGHSDVRPRNCLLTTRDAHKLYAKFGFVETAAMKRMGVKG